MMRLAASSPQQRWVSIFKEQSKESHRQLSNLIESKNFAKKIRMPLLSVLSAAKWCRFVRVCPPVWCVSLCFAVAYLVEISSGRLLRFLSLDYATVPQ
eukprot:4587462-Amphidinium_carterae.1